MALLFFRIILNGFPIYMERIEQREVTLDKDDDQKGTSRKGAIGMVRKDHNWIAEYLRNYQLELNFMKTLGRSKKCIRTMVFLR